MAEVQLQERAELNPPEGRSVRDLPPDHPDHFTPEEVREPLLLLAEPAEVVDITAEALAEVIQVAPGTDHLVAVDPVLSPQAERVTERPREPPAILPMHLI